MLVVLSLELVPQIAGTFFGGILPCFQPKKVKRQTRQTSGLGNLFLPVKVKKLHSTHSVMYVLSSGLGCTSRVQSCQVMMVSKIQRRRGS